MTDLEISRALALAIGWDDVEVFMWGVMVKTSTSGIWRDFDYRDWRVTAPIAERYDQFPRLINGMWWTPHGTNADTPQKAIAMAVIGSKK